MATMKDFLTAYYSRMIFREMSHEQMVQFSGYIKNKKATNTQKIWAEELLEKDPATGEFKTIPGTDIYIPKQMPDPKLPGGEMFLEDEQWEKLFRAFQSAFQSMDGSKSDFKYNAKATKFLEQYFGSHTATGGTSVYHMFQPEKIKPSVVQKLYNAAHEDDPATLYGFLKKYEHILKPRFQGGYYSILEDNFSYKDLLDGIKSGKYNTKSSFRKKLEAVAGYIEGYKAELYNNGIPHGVIPDFSDYDQWYDNRVDTFRLDQFKNTYPKLLNTLREEKDVREVFAQHDRGAISKPLNEALKIKSYDDPQSEEYVQPKREDSLTVPETVAEWWGDTYSDCLEKYVKLRGGRNFFSLEAKAICKYLQKDLKKTDGLDGVLKNIGNAKTKLKAAREFGAEKHLAWFEKVLNEIKNDPNMKHAWAGGLKNGTHMQAIAKEIIVRAVKDKEGGLEKGKTALELLSVLHYEYTTSNVMDALGKMDVTIFSDKGLSFNKNAGMQLITNALDKSIKFAMLGIGWGVTIAGNAIRMSGRKITKYSDKAGNFKAEHDQYLSSQEDKKQSLGNDLAGEKNQRTTIQTTLNGIMAGRSYDDTKTDLENSMSQSQNSANISQQVLMNEINDLNRVLYDPATGQSNIQDPDDKQAVEEFLSRLNENPLPPIPNLRNPNIITQQNGLRVNLPNKLRSILYHQSQLSTHQQNATDSQNQLDQLVQGTETLTELNEQIARHQTEYDNWDANNSDIFEELVKHWNLLETGRNTHTGPMYNWFRHLSDKKAQKDLTARAPSIIAEYNRTHTIGA